MRKNSVPAFAILAAALTTPVLAAETGCKMDSIKSVKQDDSLIFMQSGMSFQPVLQDFFDPKDWKPGEVMRICKIDPKKTSSGGEGLFDLQNVKRRLDVLGYRR